jgi:hypothetical protein
MQSRCLSKHSQAQEPSTCRAENWLGHRQSLLSLSLRTQNGEWGKALLLIHTRNNMKLWASNLHLRTKKCLAPFHPLYFKIHHPYHPRCYITSRCSMVTVPTTKSWLSVILHSFIPVTHANLAPMATPKPAMSRFRSWFRTVILYYLWMTYRHNKLSEI